MSGAVAVATAALASRNNAAGTIIAGQVVAYGLAETATSASIRFKTNGAYEKVEAGVLTPLGDYVDPAGAASLWEIRATVEDGVIPSGSAVDTWLALSSQREWIVNRFAVGFFQTVLTFEFRRVGSGVVEKTISGNTIVAERF